MNDEQRRAILPELDRLTRETEKIKNELDYSLSEHKINEPAMKLLAETAHTMYRRLYSAAETLRRESVATVQDYVTGWYHALHVEVHEDYLPDPVYESCTYDGSGFVDDQWTVIMTTVTHGREKVIVQSDGVSYFQVYSAEKKGYSHDRQEKIRYDVF